MKESWEKGILSGPLYDEINMLKCLAWINEKSKEKECVEVLCAHSYE